MLLLFTAVCCAGVLGVVGIVAGSCDIDCRGPLSSSWSTRVIDVRVEGDMTSGVGGGSAECGARASRVVWVWINRGATVTGASTSLLVLITELSVVEDIERTCRHRTRHQRGQLVTVTGQVQHQSKAKKLRRGVWQPKIFCFPECDMLYNLNFR